MTERMRVMIADDGSSYVDAAINDLQNAGLPPNARILVVSIADLFAISLPPPDFDLSYHAARRVDAVLCSAKGGRLDVFDDVGRRAAARARSLQRRFPGWKVGSRAYTGKPVTELLQTADEWRADLIVMGSHGRSAIGRLFLGSVSRSVAEQAERSVRVVTAGWKADARSNKVIVGVRDPFETRRVIRSLLRRHWPRSTEFHILAVDDGLSGSNLVSPVHAQCITAFEQGAERLRSAGLDATVEVRSGDIKAELLGAADDRSANSIFLYSGNSKDSSFTDEAVSLVSKAKCPVELVR